MEKDRRPKGTGKGQRETPTGHGEERKHLLHDRKKKGEEMGSAGGGTEGKKRHRESNNVINQGMVLSDVPSSAKGGSPNKTRLKLKSWAGREEYEDYQPDDTQAHSYF